ncbi:MAG TPA: hypothetical protein VEB23_16125 [Ramlibacter sp.]|nr:hypothetical protein [Ramlibacter sp.]
MEGASGGSTGGASASDLERGYTDCSEHREDYMGDAIAPYQPERPQGFLDRPQGWDR